MKKIILFIFSILMVSNTVNAACNAQLKFSTPDSRFVIHDNGTVTDNQTNLMWMRCSHGQMLSENTCVGSESLLNWQDALTQAEAYTLANYEDWRLPNIKELTSITESACHHPSINQNVFPTSGTAWDYYWSSSTFAGDASEAWLIFFTVNQLESRRKTTTAKMRLVRGGL